MRLHARYGSPRHENKDDPLDELVFILLSQMTTHHSFRRVFERLREAAPTWARVLALSLDELKDLIKDAGLSGQKAPRLREIFTRIRDDFGEVTLDPLRAMSDQDAERYLTRLPGVGTKTAKCVLMYSLGRAVLPVDTHVWRLAKRLRLVPEKLPYTRVHQELEAVVAPGDRYALHVNALAFGRDVCLALYPKCGTCQLIGLCPFGQRRLSRPAGRSSTAARTRPA